MELEQLQTKRLIIKLYFPKDLDHIFENFSEEEIKSELGFIDQAAFDKQLDIYRQGHTSYNRSLVQIQLALKKTYEIIGSCGYHNWETKHKRAELGYWLYKEEHKRKGYMGEALKAIIKYGFEVLELNRIEACIGKDNVASQKLVLANGFTKEGVLRRHYFINEKFEDSLIYSLLRNEYIE